MAKLAELPTTLDFLLDFPGGGLAWVGSYGPPASVGRRRHAGCRRSKPTASRRSSSPGRWRAAVTTCCASSPASTRRTPRRSSVCAACMGELADVVLDHGYVPYKASADAARTHHRASRSRVGRALGRVRTPLDPERRMNPGRWPGT